MAGVDAGVEERVGCRGGLGSGVALGVGDAGAVVVGIDSNC